MTCVKITNLNFNYDVQRIFTDVSLTLDCGHCYVVSGLNGCGKSTLLKLISGKKLCPYGSVTVCGKDPFRDTSTTNDIAYLSNDWGTNTVAYSGYNIPIQSSIQVKDMMVDLRKTYPNRDNELRKVLGINLEWSLNSISEGQRKRVQLYLGLVKPFKICLLDEITVNLDVLVKTRLMNYLKKESKENNACVVYVTHIFDGLNDWCSKLIYMKKSNEISIYEMKDVPHADIFSFLLHEFTNEYDESEVEEEQNKQLINRKNAGGYTPGVLHNYDI